MANIKQSDENQQTSSTNGIDKTNGLESNISPKAEPLSSNETEHEINEKNYDGEKNTIAHYLLPENREPFIRLLRLDRPIGTWLLAWPSFWGLIAAYRSELSLYPGLPADQTPALFNNFLASQPLLLFALFLLGAFLTRSAGCVFNDIADRKIDAQVARTKSRPIASGAISVKTAVKVLALLLTLALLILLQFNYLTIGLGVFILLPILIYPFMKRITYWPQAMLSLCFSWGCLMGWTAIKGSIDLPVILMTIAAFTWTMGFDTIYAHQDKEDDAVIGMKSTALKFGKSTQTWLIGFYGLTIVLLYVVGMLIGAKLIYFTTIGMAALHASWQIGTLKLDDPANCLQRFKSNGVFGLIVFIGFTADHLLALALRA